MESQIKTNAEISKDIQELNTKIDYKARERTNLTKSINKMRKQVSTLEELLDNNNQYQIPM